MAVLTVGQLMQWAVRGGGEAGWQAGSEKRAGRDQEGYACTAAGRAAGGSDWRVGGGFSKGQAWRWIMGRGVVATGGRHHELSRIGWAQQGAWISSERGWGMGLQLCRKAAWKKAYIRGASCQAPAGAGSQWPAARWGGWPALEKAENLSGGVDLNTQNLVRAAKSVARASGRNSAGRAKGAGILI